MDCGKEVVDLELAEDILYTCAVTELRQPEPFRCAVEHGGVGCDGSIDLCFDCTLVGLEEREEAVCGKCGYYVDLPVFLQLVEAVKYVHSIEAYEICLVLQQCLQIHLGKLVLVGFRGSALHLFLAQCYAAVQVRYKPLLEDCVGQHACKGRRYGECKLERHRLCVKPAHCA